MHNVECVITFVKSVHLHVQAEDLGVRLTGRLCAAAETKFTVEGGDLPQEFLLLVFKGRHHPGLGAREVRA